MDPRPLTALVFGVFGLLAVVILVGLVQKSLDTTGVALALCGLLVGTGGGILARFRSPADKPTEKSDKDD